LKGCGGETGKRSWTWHSPPYSPSIPHLWSRLSSEISRYSLPKRRPIGMLLLDILGRECLLISLLSLTTFFYPKPRIDNPPMITFHLNISRPKPETIVLDTLNPDFWILVSTVETFDFKLNPLFWISRRTALQQMNCHLIRAENFKISWLLIGFLNSAINTLIGWFLYNF